MTSATSRADSTSLSYFFLAGLNCVGSFLLAIPAMKKLIVGLFCKFELIISLTTMKLFGGLVESKTSSQTGSAGLSNFF